MVWFDMMTLTNSSVGFNSTTGLRRDYWLYVAMTGLTALLSFVGCISLIMVYCTSVTLQTYGRRLLVYLSVSDLLTALGNLLGIIWYVCHANNATLDRSYCTFQSLLTIYSSNASFLWTLVIGIHLNRTLLTIQGSGERHLKMLFHLICWGFPGVIAAVALGFDVLGYDETLAQATWCWIDPRVPHAVFWQFFTGKAWEILACILTIGLYARLKIFLLKQKKKSKEIVQQRKKKQHIINEANRKLTFVPVVFIVLRFWGTLRFLLGVFAHEYASSPDSAWLAPLQGIGDSAQGFANFVLYCFFTERVRQQLEVTLCRCFAKRRQRKIEDRHSGMAIPSHTHCSSDNTNQNS